MLSCFRLGSHILHTRTQEGGSTLSQSGFTLLHQCGDTWWLPYQEAWKWSSCNISYSVVFCLLCSKSGWLYHIVDGQNHKLCCKTINLCAFLMYSLQCAGVLYTALQNHPKDALCRTFIFIFFPSCKRAAPVSKHYGFFHWWGMRGSFESLYRRYF